MKTKVTKSLITAVAKKFGMSEIDTTKALNGSGVARSANNMLALDFDNYRLDKVDGVADGKPTFVTIVSEGSVPKGMTPALTLCAADFDYVPIVGEQVLGRFNDDDTLYPIFVMGSSKTQVKGSGMYEGDKWDGDFKLSDIWVPTYLVTEAGLISIAAYNHFFSTFTYSGQRSGEESKTLGAPEFKIMSDKLVAAGLTFRDLFDYLGTPPDDDVETTKFFKKHAKKAKSVDSCTLTELLTGRLVSLDDQEDVSELQGFDIEKAAFDAHVDSLKGSALKALYTAICDKAKIKEDDRETSVAQVKAHIKSLVSTEKRLTTLIEGGAYTPA